MTVTFKSENAQRDSLAPFFLLAFLITWGIGALAIFLPELVRELFGELTDTSALYFVAIAAPTLSATLLSLAQGGWTGLQRLWARLFIWRISLRWYALVLIGIPAAGWIAARIAGVHPLKAAQTTTEWFWLIFFILVTGPLCEELGWRGFALPRLLKRFTPFNASLILGAIWGVWHLPAFFVSGMVQAGMSLPLFLLNALLLSIFVTWVFRHTGGSVLVAVLIHFMVNICASVIGVTIPVLACLLLAVNTLILVFDKQAGWFKPADSHQCFTRTGEGEFI